MSSYISLSSLPYKRVSQVWRSRLRYPSCQTIFLNSRSAIREISSSAAATRSLPITFYQEHQRHHSSHSTFKPPPPPPGPTKMTPSTPPNQIYQYSLLNALMSGLCNEGITARKLLQHGTQGLGTFANMDGELVMLDSTIYHFHADGSVVRALQPTKGFRLPWLRILRLSVSCITKQ